MFLHNTVKIITVLSMLYSKKENSSQKCTHWGRRLSILTTVTLTHGGEGVQSPNHAWPFATLWTAVRQASLSLTISQSLLKLLCPLS